VDYLWRKKPEMMCLMGGVGDVGNIKGVKKEKAVLL